MAMRTDNFSELLDTPLRKVFFMDGKVVPQEHQRWINVDSIDRAFEDDYKVTGLGAVPGKLESESILFEDAVEGSTKRYTPTPFALGFIITREMWDDDLHNVMRRMTLALRKSFDNLYEVEAYKILNNATSASGRYAGLDGLALLSTAHTLYGTGDTVANKPSTDVDISYTAVQAALLNFHALVDDKGLPEFKNPSQVIVSGQNQFPVSEIFKNGPMEFGTDQNNKNFVIGSGPDGNGINDVVFSRYFDDDDMWFILSEKSEHSLRMVVRVRPEFDMADDFQTMNVQARGYTRLISGFSEWRGVYGSTGA